MVIQTRVLEVLALLLGDTLTAGGSAGTQKESLQQSGGLERGEESTSRWRPETPAECLSILEDLKRCSSCRTVGLFCDTAKQSNLHMG